MPPSPRIPWLGPHFDAVSKIAPSLRLHVFRIPPHRRLLFPLAPLKFKWDLFMLMLIIYSCISAPFRIGMSHYPTGTHWPSNPSTRTSRLPLLHLHYGRLTMAC